ncbi:MAG: type I-E CRISPR-associated endoribonuclease Cas2e [Longimicrobiaceae bacterium]
MLVLVLECAPPKLYGFCSSWALQVATGVYVANLPAKTREQIWEQVVQWATGDTRATMVWDSRGSEQGLEHRVLGSPRRTITEREGLLISKWIPLSPEDAIGPENKP